MRFLRCLIFLLLWKMAANGQEFLDRLDEHLSWSSADNNIRARLSGTFDLEFYRFEQPPPGLIDADGRGLVNPRLSLFLDAQAGSTLYFFAQARIDRHFDPTDQGTQFRLDEYALRYTPWEDGRLSIEIGKSATIFGRWVNRHLSWDNPFVTAPLVYENALPIEDKEPPPLPFTGHRQERKNEYLAEIWGPDYATGLTISGVASHFDYAFRVQNSALAARPESWNATEIGFDYPTITARVGYRPDESWNLGFSASDGAYFRPEAEPFLPPGRDIGDYHESVIAQDISFAHGHFQFWAEFHEARFEIPRLGDGESFGYFLEAKYKFTPQLFGAIRWNQQYFNDVSNGVGSQVQFAPDISRLETGLTYRFTEHLQAKLEYYPEFESGRDVSHNFALQVTVRF
jgi:hypothetical protein